MPEDVLNIWICQQFASISTETNSEKGLRPKNETKSERVPSFGHVWGKIKSWKEVPYSQANLLALCTFLSSLQYQHEVPPTGNMQP